MSRKNYSLYLADEQQKKLEKAVEGGKFASKAEYIRHLIRKHGDRDGC